MTLLVTPFITEPHIHRNEWKKKIEVHVLVGKKGDETKTGSDNVIASKNIPIKQKIIVMH